MKCGKKCEVYSRVVGYHRPVQNWNHGKKSEFSDRVEFQEDVSLKNERAKVEVSKLKQECC
jgi:ribonucleoside-triphosphate reductase